MIAIGPTTCSTRSSRTSKEHLGQRCQCRGAAERSHGFELDVGDGTPPPKAAKTEKVRTKRQIPGIANPQPPASRERRVRVARRLLDHRWPQDALPAERLTNRGERVQHEDGTQNRPNATEAFVETKASQQGHHRRRQEHAEQRGHLESPRQLQQSDQSRPRLLVERPAQGTFRQPAYQQLRTKHGSDDEREQAGSVHEEKLPASDVEPEINQIQQHGKAQSHRLPLEPRQVSHERALGPSVFLLGSARSGGRRQHVACDRPVDRLSDLGQALLNQLRLAQLADPRLRHFRDRRDDVVDLVDRPFLIGDGGGDLANRTQIVRHQARELVEPLPRALGPPPGSARLEPRPARSGPPSSERRCSIRRSGPRACRVASSDCSARERISRDTTLKPRACCPERTASIAALRASRFD